MGRINMQDKNKKFIIIYIVIGVLGRLIPHPPNVTPLTNLCLFAGSNLSRGLAFITMLICYTISNIALAYFNGYPIFGYWTIFTYSGLAFIVLLGSRLSKSYNIKKLVTYVGVSTFVFWVWSNFGCWLATPLYPKDFNGLISCYIAALPFLRNALLGNLVWMVVIFGIYNRLKQYIAVLDYD